ncbi:MAG: hypothetical protein IJP71_00200 [Lachnospiraceae bacterium]|nr:hypothetical protein [Lachnospiraceae bacterium]
MKKQIKSKKRVSDHGEVFTNEREVNAMLDLVKDETLRIDSRFLEPACGDGNFLIEILKRKIDVVNKKYKKDEKEWEKQSLVAIMSCYGVELLQDNVEACIDRLYSFWEKEYEKHCEKIKSEKVKQVAKFILSKNILCGNALTMLRVDKNGNDTKNPIVFSEWSFVIGDKVKRREFRFDELLKINNKNPDTNKLLTSIEYDNSLKEWIAEPIKEYNLVDYKDLM